MDRSIASIPKAQQGFITYICLPLLESLVELYPQLKGITHNMRENVRTLHEMESMSTDQIMAMPIPTTLTSPVDGSHGGGRNSNDAGVTTVKF